MVLYSKSMFWHSEPFLLHFEKCHFRMGGKFYAISPQLNFWRIGSGFLQMVHDYSNWWTCLHGFQSDHIRWRWKGRGTLWTYIQSWPTINYNIRQMTTCWLPFFKTKLLAYLWVAIIGMKKDTLYQHKDVIITCGESMGDGND
jgi:hypothetical protein